MLKLSGGVGRSQLLTYLKLLLQFRVFFAQGEVWKLIFFLHKELAKAERSRTHAPTDC